MAMSRKPREEISRIGAQLTSCNSLGLEIIDIFVGPLQTHFRVHKKLLCTRSQYFERMFSSGFKEVIDSTIRMPEDDPDVFDMFVQWVYERRLDTADMTKHTPKSGPLGLRFKLYCFAEEICLNDLMDYTISSFMSNYTKHVKSASVHVMSLAYEGTSKGSKLRLFIAHELVYILRTLGNSSFWPDKDLGWVMTKNEDLAVDVVSLLRSSSKDLENPARFSKYQYHVHANNHECLYKDNIP